MCQHINQVIDEQGGCYVCLDCAFVIQDQVFVFPSTENKFESQFCIYHQFIKDCCHRGHIIDHLALRSIEFFEKFKIEKKLESTVDLFLVASYSIYYTLKVENAPRSLKMISALTGISMKALTIFENKYILLPKSINVYQMLQSKHQYFRLNSKDLEVLQKIAKEYENKSFSPNTLAGALIYLFLGYKSTPCKVNSIANIFQITPACMYRCIRYLKSNNFNSILTF